MVHTTTSGFVHSFHGLAALLTSDGMHDERLHRWLFFISDGDQRGCIQLLGKPKDVDYCLPAPEGHPLERKTFKQRATAKDRPACLQRVQQYQQRERSKGAAVASGILGKDPNVFACQVLNSAEMPEGIIYLHMWRCDLVEMVMAQRGLKRIASVPFRVWRRLLQHKWNDQPFAVYSSMLLAGLVCWECGAMPCTLRQCACGVACFCSRQCQCAGWKGHHSKWCKPVMTAAAQAADPKQFAHMVKPLQRDMLLDQKTAVRRIPEVGALVELHYFGSAKDHNTNQCAQ